MARCGDACSAALTASERALRIAGGFCKKKPGSQGGDWLPGVLDRKGGVAEGEPLPAVFPVFAGGTRGGNVPSGPLLK